MTFSPSRPDRTELAPGLDISRVVTGLWQVSGRNNVSYRRRVALDVLYAKRKSFSLYCYILLKTLPAVLLREGSY